MSLSVKDKLVLIYMFDSEIGRKTMVVKLKKVYKEILRRKINDKNRSRLKNENFTILSSNCTGGVLSHDLGLQFLSPTINMFICPKDFVKFLTNLEEYLSLELEERIEPDLGYPVAILGDIVLHGLHYSSFQIMKEKWNERKQRINLSNLYVMMFERDGCTYDDVKAFDKLPYKHKIVFVHKEMPEISSAYYIPGTELEGNPEHKVKILTKYKSWFCGNRLIDMFDYVSFFNEK